MKKQSEKGAGGMNLHRFPSLPARMRGLAIDARGFPVPKFVKIIDGEPDFRVIDDVYFIDAIRKRRCWICGGPLGSWQAWVIGPMCAINRVNSEPPCHRECAIFAAAHCPFLAQPMAKRRERDMPEQAVDAPGLHIKRNPGVCAVWITKARDLETFSAGNGVLFHIPSPYEVLWFANGRAAKRNEIDAAIDSGLPLLHAEARHDGPDGLLALNRAIAEFRDNERLIFHGVRRDEKGGHSDASPTASPSCA